MEQVVERGGKVKRWEKYSKVDVQFLFQNIFIEEYIFLVFPLKNFIVCRKLVNNCNLIFKTFYGNH